MRILVSQPEQCMPVRWWVVEGILGELAMGFGYSTHEEWVVSLLRLDGC